MDKTITLVTENPSFNSLKVIEEKSPLSSLLSHQKSPSNSTSPHSIKCNNPISTNSLSNTLYSTLFPINPPQFKDFVSPSLNAKESITFSPNCHQKENESNVLLQSKRKRTKRTHINIKKDQTCDKEKFPKQTKTPFMKQMMLKYPEEKYLEDVKQIEEGSMEFFMKENFPTMFTHTSYYSFSVCLRERRENHSEIFIDNCSLRKNKDNFYLFNHNNLNEAEFVMNIPKKIWAPPMKDIDYEDFYNKCVQVWPFNECCFVKEFALEFLMRNDYDIDQCLKNLREFVVFSQKKTKESDIPVVRTDAKIIKNYSLRMQKKD